MSVNEGDVAPIAKASQPPPRPRGQPKDSKNGVNAKNVGRPRKDGLPPKKQKNGTLISQNTAAEF